MLIILTINLTILRIIIIIIITIIIVIIIVYLYSADFITMSKSASHFFNSLKYAELTLCLCRGRQPNTQSDVKRTCPVIVLLIKHSVWRPFRCPCCRGMDGNFQHYAC